MDEARKEYPDQIPVEERSYIEIMPYYFWEIPA